jgi:undecaprenyl-phosphate galactose phosphotransferase
LLYRPWGNFFHFGASKVLGLTIIMVFIYQEQYIKRRPFWEELLQIYRSLAFLLLINLGLSFVLAKSSLKILIVSFWLGFALALPIFRYLAKQFMAELGIWQRQVFILGYGKLVDNANNLFVQNKLMGYQLVGVVDPRDIQAPSDDSVPQTCNIEQLLIYLANNSQTEVIVALNQADLIQYIELINQLQHRCLAVLIVPELSGLALYGSQIEHFFGNDQLILRLHNNLARQSNIIIKRLFDLVCVILGLLILFPVFILIAVIILLTTKNKVFFYHQRVGKHGKIFNCIKFQTMYPNSQEILKQLLASDEQLRQEWEREFKLKNDPRVTPIGRFLRHTSLDELPQLFNVLRGDMSLIGPRPIIQQEIERYADKFYYYQLVTPGISGLWQVSGRNDIDYTNRVRLDEWYVKNWSLWYDIVILLKTINVVIKRTGAY